MEQKSQSSGLLGGFYWQFYQLFLPKINADIHVRCYSYINIVCLAVVLESHRVLPTVLMNKKKETNKSCTFIYNKLKLKIFSTAVRKCSYTGTY